MSFRLLKHIFIQLMFASALTFGQAYKADYNKLTAPLLDKDPPVICIIEDGSSLFDTLSQYPEFTKKYTCYSTEALTGLKALLKVNQFNPEDYKFLQAVKSKLSAGYILNWKTSHEPGGIFLLEIFSTSTSSRVYTRKFFPSINSDPFNDAKKLLIDSLEVYYTLAHGELTITSYPDSARFRLLKSEEVILEWKGAFKQPVEAGTYKLITELENYIKKETEIVVQEGSVTSLDIQLQPEFSKFIKVKTSDGIISNIRTEFTNDQIKIVYDLGGKDKSKFDIEMTLKNSRTGDMRELQRIYGDLANEDPGINKTIIWHMQTELGVFPKDTYEVEISAKKSGGVPWYYYAGGAALLGGITLLFGGGGDEDPGNSTIKAGTPPGRP